MHDTIPHLDCLAFASNTSDPNTICTWKSLVEKQRNKKQMHCCPLYRCVTNRRTKYAHSIEEREPLMGTDGINNRINKPVSENSDYYRPFWAFPNVKVGQNPRKLGRKTLIVSFCLFGLLVFMRSCILQKWP